MSGRRTIPLRIVPELAAFLTYLEANEREYSHRDYDLFAAGYRARDSESQHDADTRTASADPLARSEGAGL